jgi:hypothetical protein
MYILVVTLVLNFDLILIKNHDIRNPTQFILSTTDYVYAFKHRNDVIAAPLRVDSRSLATENAFDVHRLTARKALAVILESLHFSPNDYPLFNMNSDPEVSVWLNLILTQDVSPQKEKCKAHNYSTISSLSLS